MDENTKALTQNFTTGKLLKYVINLWTFIGVYNTFLINNINDFNHIIAILY